MPITLIWLCIRIQLFWNNVIQIMEEILNLKVPRDPQIVYLGLMLGEVIENKETYLFSSFRTQTTTFLGLYCSRAQTLKKRTMYTMKAQGRVHDA